MHIRLIFIFLTLFNLTSGIAIGQDINCLENPLDIQLKSRFYRKCSYQILSKNSSMYCFRDSLGYYHIIGLYFLERAFYKKDERFEIFITQLNAGCDTIVFDSMKIIISGLEYFQVDGDSKSKWHRTPIYYLNPSYFAEGLNCVYFFNIGSYQFLASTAGIKKVYISHWMNGVGKKAHKYPMIFFDAECLFIGGQFEMDYGNFFPNIRLLIIRAENDFRYNNFSKLEKVYFISFTFSELMKTNILNKPQIDVFMLFIYSIDYQFELIGNLNLNHIRSLNLCFPTRNEEEINVYINKILSLECIMENSNNKIKVATFYR